LRATKAKTKRRPKVKAKAKAKPAGKPRRRRTPTAEYDPLKVRPRDAALAGGIPPMSPSTKADLRQMLTVALAGKNHPLHESVLLAGYHHFSTLNPLVVADRLGIRFDYFRQRIRDDPDFLMPEADVQRLERSFEKVVFDRAWLKVLLDTHAGFWPELDAVIIETGYARDDHVPTQAKLAEMLGVDVRTVRRWVAGGAPTVRKGRAIAYPFWAVLGWRMGHPAKSYSRPGLQIANFVARILSDDD